MHFILNVDNESLSFKEYILKICLTTALLRQIFKRWFVNQFDIYLQFHNGYLEKRSIKTFSSGLKVIACKNVEKSREI